MTDSERIAAIEQSRSTASARRLVREAPAGFETRLFEHTKHVVGTDPAIAVRLALAGEAFGGSWGHRFRAVKLRLQHKWLASANAFLKAEAESTNPTDGAAMAVGAIDSLARAGRVDRAVKTASRLMQALNHAGRTQDVGRAALNAGNALLWSDRVEEAIPFFERAVANLDQSLLERAGAYLGLSTAQIDFGTAALVKKPAERALETFESLGLTQYAAVAEQNLAQADLMSGRFDTALQRLLRLKHSFPKNSEEFARNEQHLGETYLRLNMPVEARFAYRDALRAPATKSLPYTRAQCHLGIAEANLAMEDREAAIDAAEKAHTAFRRLGNDAGAALAKSIVLAASTESDHREVQDLVEKLDRHSLRRRTADLLFQLSEKAQDRRALAKGRTIVHKYGLVDMEWRLHAANARTTDHHKRLDSYRSMAKAMWQARSVHQSTIARQHFLRDKDTALREYLGELLTQPTKENVEEALQVVGEARSVSLIDEILGARKGRLTHDQARQLEEVREKIREELHRETRTDGARRSPPVDLENWRRAWHEAEGLIHATSDHKRAKAPDQTFVQAKDRYFSIQEGRAQDLGDSAEIDRRIRWLAFDLLEPIVNPLACPKKVNKAAIDLATRLDVKASATILPDEALWHLPWPLLMASEPVLSIAPGFNRTYRPVDSPKSVTVWYQPSDRLPHIQQEVESIVKTFPQASLCGSLAEVRKSLQEGRVDLLHIATHAALNAWNPMFSYLQFDDGRLFAAEIARGGLRPRLVTMSACEAGSVSTVESNEPDGLVRAALALGAESVVASAWPLDDRASALFTQPYYRAIDEGSDVIEAVARGRSAVREQLEHPYYWAPMVVFGGYFSE